MAKTTGPLLSFGGRGQIGSTVVFADWKGRSYARQYVIPSNPDTAEQQLTRNTFRWLQSVYKVAPALVTAPWELYAKGKVLTARNAWTAFNNGALREETDLALLTLSPGALGGLPPTALEVTPGDDSLTVAITAPSVGPQDWTIASAVAAIIRDQDPQSETLYDIVADEDESSAYEIVFAGLEEELYQVFAWLKWTRADGLTAYSPSIISSGTPT